MLLSLCTVLRFSLCEVYEETGAFAPVDIFTSIELDPLQFIYILLILKYDFILQGLLASLTGVC